MVSDIQRERKDYIGEGLRVKASLTYGLNARSSDFTPPHPHPSRVESKVGGPRWRTGRGSGGGGASTTALIGLSS